MSAGRINLAETADFELGGLRVSPAHREAAMDGKRFELEPRVAQVLVALAQARPSVVSRDRLIEQCWDGRIVGDDALNRCILALRHMAKEFSPEPFTIETVPRVGYSLIEQANGTSRRWPRNTILAVVAAMVLLAGVLGYAWSRFGSSASDPASIAVLPFRNLSSDDSYFAEGVSEEILGQLAREPAFQVAGRASSAQFTGSFEPRDVGRKLGVDYFLEGSVRSDGGRVRINASLVRTRDGIRLWSQTYDRKLEDILEIQSSIGQSVSGELRRRLIHSPSGRAVNAEAYRLYLNARGLLRSGNPQSGAEAVSLLKKAVQLDPGFAPAWSSLAEALYLDGRGKGIEGMIATLPPAQAAARRALRIDQNSAEAHGMLGQLLGNENPEGLAHMRRAAELAPRTSEGQIWKAVSLNAVDDFHGALGAYRRSHELDPLWQQPVRALVDTESEMGNRKAAEALVRSSFADDPVLQQFGLARIAWFFGDYSDSARRFALVAKSSERWSRPAQRSLGDLRYMLKLTPERPESAPVAIVGLFSRYLPLIWTAAPPSPAEWQHRNRSWNATLVYLDENVVAAKLMLNAGRARELVATYDSPTGLLGLRRGIPVANCQVLESALVAAALRTAGRRQEAASILHQTDVLLRGVYRRGNVPPWYDDDAAQVWAMQGKSDAALDALERALSRGWVHAGRRDLMKIEDEPGFRSLHGNPRFEAIRSKIAAHFAKERRETAQALQARG